MGLRRRSREFALQILFQREFLPELDPRELVSNFSASFQVEKEVTEYGLVLVAGLFHHLKEIDGLIQKYSRHWKVERMALVDLNIMRIGTFELFFLEPPLGVKMVINEALEISKRYGSQDSPAFVNGVLDQMVKGERG